MLINRFITDWTENICLSWLSGFRRLKSSFKESGANRIPNCIQLLTSLVIIATAAISRAKEKNTIKPSTITSSSA